MKNGVTSSIIGFLCVFLRKQYAQVGSHWLTTNFFGVSEKIVVRYLHHMHSAYNDGIHVQAEITIFGEALGHNDPMHGYF